MSKQPEASSSSSAGVTTKRKSFNKKTWRENQYSHKQKVDEWKSRRNFAIKKSYEKMLKKEHINRSQPSGQNLYSENDDTETSETHQPPRRMSEFQKAKLVYENKKAELAQKKEDAVRRKAEREEAVKLYKQRKVERIKKLSQKTKKGQPVMKGRIELLLEKIQRQVNAEQQ